MPTAKRNQENIIFNLRGDDEDRDQLKKNSIDAGYVNMSNFVRNRLGLKEVIFDKETKTWIKK